MYWIWCLRYQLRSYREGGCMHTHQQSFENPAGVCAVFVVFPASSADVLRRVNVRSGGSYTPTSMLHSARGFPSNRPQTASCRTSSASAVIKWHILSACPTTNSPTLTARVSRTYTLFLIFYSPSNCFLRAPLTAYSNQPACPINESQGKSTKSTKSRGRRPHGQPHAKKKRSAEEQQAFLIPHHHGGLRRGRGGYGTVQAHPGLGHQRDLRPGWLRRGAGVGTFFIL